MAIAIRGSATGTSFTSSSVDWNNVAFPSGCTTGDIVFVFLVTNSTTTVSSLSGWTQVDTIQNAASDATTAVAYRILSGSETSWSFTGLWATAQFGLAVTIAWTPSNGYVFNPSTCIHKQAHNTQTIALAGSLTGPSISPTIDNCMFMHFGGTDPSTSTSYGFTADTSPTATEQYDSKTSSGSYAYAYCQTYQQGTAASLALDATNAGVNDDYASWHIALLEELAPTGWGPLLAGQRNQLVAS